LQIDNPSLHELSTLLRIRLWQYFITVIDRRAPASGYGGHSGEMSASVFVTQPQAILRGSRSILRRKRDCLVKGESSTTAGKR